MNKRFTSMQVEMKSALSLHPHRFDLPRSIRKVESHRLVGSRTLQTFPTSPGSKHRIHTTQTANSKRLITFRTFLSQESLFSTRWAKKEAHPLFSIGMIHPRQLIETKVNQSLFPTEVKPVRHLREEEKGHLKGKRSCPAVPVCPHQYWLLFPKVGWKPRTF